VVESKAMSLIQRLRGPLGVGLLFFWAGVVTVLRWLLPRAPALSRFQRAYGSEGILGVTPEEQKTLNLPFRCTGCGQCDLAEAGRIANTNVGYRGLQAFVLGGARSLPDSEAVAASLSEVPDEAIAHAEKVCPEHVPIVALVQLVRGHAKRQEEARRVVPK
jgi:hypothetical protein